MYARNYIAGLALVGVLVAVPLVAEAGTRYESYSTTVTKFNGNGYTETQTKVVTDKSGSLSSSSVGGKYKVDACMALPRHATCVIGASWIRVDDGTQASLKNWVVQGNTPRVRFSNDLRTPVNVQVSGSWKSN